MAAEEGAGRSGAAAVGPAGSSMPEQLLHPERIRSLLELAESVERLPEQLMGAGVDRLYLVARPFTAVGMGLTEMLAKMAGLGVEGEPLGRPEKPVELRLALFKEITAELEALPAEDILAVVAAALCR